MSRLQRILQVVSIAGIANFLLFAAVATAIGGDAVNGMEAGGRYYLSSHGQTTEVSRAVFVYSQAHAVSAVVGIVLSMAAGLAYRATGGPPTRGPCGKEGP